jgi:hypothetical protein
MQETPQQDPLASSLETVKLKHADARSKNAAALQARAELQKYLDAHIELLKQQFRLDAPG